MSGRQNRFLRSRSRSRSRVPYSTSLTSSRSRARSRAYHSRVRMRRTVIPPTGKVLVLKGVSAFPRRLFCKLRFQDDTNLSFPTANSAQNIRYRPSSAYDLDPTIASTATIGFSEWATLYQYYRVHAVTVKISVYNQSNIPVGIVLFPSNTDPGNGLAWNQLREYSANPGGIMKVAHSLTGAPSACIIRKKYTADFVLGSDTYKYDDSYASLTNGSPGNNWYVGFGAFSLEGAAVNWTGKIDYTVELIVNVEFYEPKLLTS